MAVDVKRIGKQIEKENGLLLQLRNEMGKVLVGQEALVESLLTALLCNGHVLLEGMPGLAKTLAVTTLAKLVDASFNRIQFTPDLLPADLVGTLIYRPDRGEFEPKKGPVFANLILADEINRAPAKVQSALLEAMQERQITIGDTTYPLEDPFLVLATQNPIEQEGTYPLPEAQVDRFLLKCTVTYPSKEQERTILKRMAKTSVNIDVAKIMEIRDLRRLRSLTDDIFMDEKVEHYIVDLVDATRNPGDYGLDIASYVQYGASPRATIGITLASRARALLDGRGFVTPQDVKAIAKDVLRHRVAVTYEAEAEEKTSEDLVQAVLDGVEVP